MFFSAKENAAVGNGGRRIAVLSQGVLGNDFKLWGGPDDFRSTIVGDEINQAAGCDERSTKMAAEPLLPKPLARLGDKTVRRAAIIGHD